MRAITFAPVTGKIERVSGVIADQSGSGGTGANARNGSLILNGAGTLDLIAAAPYTGGTTIDEGTLELANPKAAGSGGIDFASTSGEVEFAAGAAPRQQDQRLPRLGQNRFLEGRLYRGRPAVDNSGKVSIETVAGKTVARFKVSTTYPSANFHVGKESQATSSSPTSRAGRRPYRPADILGSLGAEFAEPAWSGASNLYEFNSWSALASSAGPTPAFSASIVTETPAARRPAGRRRPAGTARPATGLGLAVNAGWPGLRGGGGGELRAGGGS